MCINGRRENDDVNRERVNGIYDCHAVAWAHYRLFNLGSGSWSDDMLATVCFSRNRRGIVCDKGAA